MEEVDREVDVVFVAGVHGQKHPHKDEPDPAEPETVVDELQQHKAEGDEMEGEEKENQKHRIIHRRRMG